MTSRRAVLALIVVLLVPGCDGPTEPSPANLTGSWIGTSTYPNAPFTLRLAQTGSALTGDYRDELDRSLAVTGTYTPPTFTLVVDFGDAKLNLTGTVVSDRTAEGTMFTSALGNRPYAFQMTR